MSIKLLSTLNIALSFFDLVIIDEYKRTEDCTFVDDKCRDGEDLRYATEKLS